jgi:hypothetical protein
MGNRQVKEELLALRAADASGMLRPAVALAWAKRHPNSALHAALEWDNDTAAEAHRLDQIRRLISLHVVSVEGDPLLVSLSLDRVKGGGYRAIDDVLASRDLSAIMLADALGELERVQAKYSHVRELTAVWEQVRGARRRRREAAEETRPRA